MHAATSDTASFDIGEGGELAEQTITLDADAVRFGDGRVLPIGELTEAKTIEGLGVDEVQFIGADGVLATARFSRKRRREMNRFARHVQRRIDGKDNWLDRAEALEAVGDDEPADESKRVLFRLYEVARPYRWHLLGAVVFTVVSAAATVAPSIITKFLIDDAIDPGYEVDRATQIARLFGWSAAYAVAIVLMSFAMWARLRLLGHVGSHVAGDLRNKVYVHLHSLSMRYFGKHRVGSLITRVTSDTDRLWDFIVFGSIEQLRSVLLMVAAGIWMFWANPTLALIALAPLPPVAVLTWWKTKKMTDMFGRLWTYWGRLTAIVGDALPGVKVVKAFGAEGREAQKFGTRNRDFTDDELNTVNVWVNLQPVVDGVMMLTRVIILLGGGWLIIDAADRSGDHTIGTLMSFLMITGFFHMAIIEIVQKQRIVTRAATSAQRVFEVLDAKPEIASKPDAITPEKLEGKVEFEHVSFSYEGAKAALKDVSLTVEPGMMVGLCGHSGAGKSTFVNLISRFYDVTDGAIKVDGHDVRDLDLQWLRSHVGVVLQEPYLFYGTIADNIRYGRPEATDADVIAAARAANAHGFICKLPDAYDTIVGERGQSLSGGERQRVSIARAILHNPKILVLDEATSSVDTDTERQIQEALDNLVEGRTVFAIAHRLSTIRNADMLVVLDGGQIVQTGTHDELLANDDGTYAKLVRTQLRLATDGMVEQADGEPIAAA
ncbi:MAG: ABC transporter ATP-binding protein [Planctomycetota bacterium]